MAELIAQALAGWTPEELEHSGLVGLDQDDHPQYLTMMRAVARFAETSHEHQHGGLLGLGSDDHRQYPDLRRVVVDIDNGTVVIDIDVDTPQYVEAA
jgi:hypothetical protein